MDGAEQLYDQIVAGGEVFIQQMVNEGRQESLYLEFKRSALRCFPVPDGERKKKIEEDRISLSKCLSGFANAEGGVVVWGVKATRPGPDEPDAANGLNPITNLALWETDLNSYTSDTVSPFVPGVQHRMIPSATDSTSGYAVTYVPKSDSLHMAIAKKNEQSCYFARSGSSFVRMEAYQVADRYQRRPQAKLSFEVTYDYVGYRTRQGHIPDLGNQSIPEEMIFKVIGRLKNYGRGISHLASVALNTNIQYYRGVQFLKDNSDFMLTPFSDNQRDGNWYLFRSKPNDVIYPDVSVVAFDLDYHFPIDAIYHVTRTSISLQPEIKLSLEYRIFSDGFYDEGIETIDLVPICAEHLRGDAEILFPLRFRQ